MGENGAGWWGGVRQNTVIEIIEIININISSSGNLVGNRANHNLFLIQFNIV
jgi:hypothetical protein